MLNWYPLITVPFFIFMGYMLSESGIADNLYRMFHVWFGPVRGGLALGTIGLMVLISAHERPLRRRHGDRRDDRAAGAAPPRLRQGMVTGVIQAGSSLGILIPPSVVLVLYGMIARQPVCSSGSPASFPG